MQGARICDNVPLLDILSVIIIKAFAQRNMVHIVGTFLYFFAENMVILVERWHASVVQ